MRLSRDDYRKAEGCLRRYDYNSATILFKRDDIFGLSATNYDGMPKAPYNVSDTVYKSVIQLEDDKEYQKALREYKAVELAKHLLNEDCIKIFEKLYRLRQSKWKIIYDEGLSERTFVRRKSELINAVSDELKKLA